MDKKLLISGSGIAVVVLVLASFNPVVGYNSVESSAKESPLFRIRTSRAINEYSKDLTCNYFGKGKVCTLFIPRRNNQIETALKVIDSIVKMDDETFEKFIASFINHIEKDNRFYDVNPDEIREALNLLRNSDKPIPILDVDTENKRLTIEEVCRTSGAGLKGYLGCFLLLLLLPFILTWAFIGWCLNIGGGPMTSICLPTSYTCDCPITFQKLK